MMSLSGILNFHNRRKQLSIDHQHDFSDSIL
jgi:hypothetical protein